MIASLVILPLIFIFIHWRAGDDVHRQRRIGLATQILLGAAATALGGLSLFGGHVFRFDGPDVRFYEGVKLPFDFYLDARNSALVLLGGIVTPLIFAWTRESGTRSYYISANLMILGVSGVFLSDSLVLFYVFWELSVVGVFFWVGLFGSGEAADRSRALFRFFLFTVLGGLGMLGAVVFLLTRAPDARITGITEIVAGLSPMERRWVFWGFFVSFAVKTPIFGLHGWMRDLYLRANPAARALLSALMSKMGAFGFITILSAAFPGELQQLWIILGPLAVGGIVYGALMTVSARTFLEALIYSSLAHLNLIVLAAVLPVGPGDLLPATGALFQMLNHGLLMAVLLVWESRTASPGAVRERLPLASALVLTAVLAAAGLPGMSNFAGEAMILFAVFRHAGVIAFIAGAGLLLTAAMLVIAYHRAYLGQGRFPGGVGALDHGARESSKLEAGFAVAVFAFWVVLGFAPSLFVKPILALLPILRY